MSAAEVPTLFDWAKDVGVPIGTFVGGFFVARFFLSKNERLEFEQKNLENTNERIADFDKAFEAYTQAISAYADAPDPDATFFARIAVTGGAYINAVNRMSSLILSGKADVQLRDDLLLPKIRAVAARTIPQHYETLQDIADKYGFPFNGKETARKTVRSMRSLKSSALVRNGRRTTDFVHIGS